MNTPLGLVIWLAVVAGVTLGFLIVGEWILIRRELRDAKRRYDETQRALAQAIARREWSQTHVQLYDWAAEHLPEYEARVRSARWS